MTAPSVELTELLPEDYDASALLDVAMILDELRADLKAAADAEPEAADPRAAVLEASARIDAIAAAVKTAKTKLTKVTGRARRKAKKRIEATTPPPTDPPLASCTPACDGECGRDLCPDCAQCTLGCRCEKTRPAATMGREPPPAPVIPDPAPAVNIAAAVDKEETPPQPSEATPPGRLGRALGRARSRLSGWRGRLARVTERLPEVLLAAVGVAVAVIGLLILAGCAAPYE